ncbi:hypothetical protein K4K52_006642 [Colletotrichum sp. SAR 10_76]|nr:hypothetical protein K4K52_006642 [Colletotrichum sp. SAR 10_76]
MDDCLYWARFDGIDTSDPYKYSEAIVKNERFKAIWGSRSSNLDTPFHGITTDGQKRDGLYKLQNEGAHTKQMCGLRLEHIDKVKVDAVMEILKQSLSESGFAKVQGAMKTNKFLGEICGKEAILNEHSYFFTIFGEPSEMAPWAFMLYGHHLALNVFIAGEQMAIGPVFIGAEPSIIDEGPDKGLTLCANESQLGLRLMQSLSPEIQQKAQVYSKMHDPAMSEDRWHPADQVIRSLTLNILAVC